MIYTSSVFFFLHLLFLKQNLNRLSKFSKDKIGDSFLGVRLLRKPQNTGSRKAGILPVLFTTES